MGFLVLIWKDRISFIQNAYQRVRADKRDKSTLPQWIIPEESVDMF